LLNTVSDILCKNKHIEIRGFGTFYTQKRKPRPARNPKTGEVVPLKERYVPLFKFSADLKQKVHGLALPGVVQAESSTQESAGSFVPAT
jgi:nucleoid DNA-binding protein